MSQVKTSTIQAGFGGGMNFRDEPDELQNDEAQLIRNMRIRGSILPSKAGVEKTRYEVPILLYERFVHDVDNPSHILRVGVSPAVTPDHIRGLMFIRGIDTVGWDVEGFISQHLPTMREGAFIQVRFDVALYRLFRLSLQRKNDVLEMDTGLELEFDVTQNVTVYEDGVSQGVVDTFLLAPVEITIKFEKQADDGWKIFKNGTLIYTTTFTGEVQNFFAVNSNNADLNIYELIYHRGFR